MLPNQKTTQQKEQETSISGSLILLLVFINAFILKIAFVSNERWYVVLFVTLPLLFVVHIYHTQKSRAGLNRSSTGNKAMEEDDTKSIGQLYEQQLS